MRIGKVLYANRDRIGDAAFKEKIVKFLTIEARQTHRRRRGRRQASGDEGGC